MPRQRPVPPNAGAGPSQAGPVPSLAGRRRPLLAAAVTVLAAGCSAGTVEVEPAPHLGRTDASACAALSDSLPDLLVGLERRPVTPNRSGTAAWGDPPVVLRCGVGEPAAFDAVATCQITNGIAWFIPGEQITGEPEDITMTTVGRSPGVEVRLPAEYFPPAATMVQLAPALKQATRMVARCG